MRKHVFYLVILFILSLIIIGCSGPVVLSQKPSTSEIISETSINEKIIYTRDKAAQYFFGQAYSISEDYLIVGATNTNSNQGQASILKNDGNNNWNEITKLELNRKSDNDYFGYSVSIFGNYAMVGAPGCNSGSGQVFILKNDGADNWKQVSSLTSKLPKKINKHFFGCSISIYGDYAIVGANSEGKDTGLVYAYKNDGADNWKEIGILRSSDKTSADNFGFWVSLYKDYAIIGAPSADAGGKNRGQAYIFKNDGADNWKEIAKLTASDQADGDYLGRRVSINGDYAIVSAPAADSGGLDRGQVYIFKNDGADNWKETAILQASDKFDDYHFGNSVSIFGKHVIVGAPGADRENGQVYIFKDVGADNWKEIDILKPSAKTLYHHFGMEVLMSEKYALINALNATPDSDKRSVIYLFPQERRKQGSYISFDKTEYDLGRIGQNEKRNFSFKFTNTGSDTLNILDVKSSCICTVVDKQEKNTLKPGESSEIKGTFYSKTYKGSLIRGIVVKSNDPEHPEVVLTINANIEESKQ